MAPAGKHIMNAALHTVSITLLSCIGAFLLQSDELADIDLSAIEQYSDDWSQATFTKIDIDHGATTGDICKTGYQPLFAQEWPGTHHCCDCTNDWRVDYMYRKFYVNDWCNIDYQYYCDDIPGYPASQMNIVENNIICGKAEGASFVNAVRPDASSKKCPSGYSACSSFTSADHTVCVKDSEDKTKVCPITRIEFKTFSTEEAAKTWAASDTYTWDFEDYDGDVYMFWTKEYDALPVTQSKIEAFQPCMNPKQSSIYEGYQPFMAEKSIPKCKEDITNGLKYDSRYIDTGIDTDLYSLHQDNGINLLLQARYYNYNAAQEQLNKQAVTLSLFNRNTLSWKLSCEADVNTSRNTFYQETSQSAFVYPTRIITAAVFAFICVGIEVCACGCGLVASANDDNELGHKTMARACATICSGLFVINIVWMAQTGATLVAEGKDDISKYVAVNTCGDDITNLPIETINNNFDEAADKATLAANLTWALLITYAISVVVIIRQIKYLKD